MSDCPHDATEWWELLEENKDSIRSLVIQFHPKSGAPRKDMKITAPGAEAVCEDIRGEIAVGGKPECPLESFDAALQKQDGLTIVRLLNETWFGIPESTECWNLEGFGVLCDLCSEAYCLDPELEGSDIEE